MQEQAPAPRKPIDVSGIMRPEIILAIAGLMTLLAGVGTPNVSVTEVIVGLIMIYSAIVSLGYIVILRAVFPAVSVSAVSGVILFFFNVETLIRTPFGGGHHWSVVVGLIAGLIALFAAFVGYFKPAFARTR